MNGELYIIILGIIIVLIITAYIFLYHFRSDQDISSIGGSEIISNLSSSNSNSVKTSDTILLEPSDKGCTSGVCVPINNNNMEECKVNEQCPGSMLCVNNKCMMCTMDNECGEGYVCVDGTCHAKKKYGESCELVPCDIGLECIKFGDGDTVKVCLPKNSVLSVTTSNTRKEGIYPNEEDTGRQINKDRQLNVIDRLSEPIYPMMNKKVTNTMGSGEIKQKVANKTQVNILAQKMEHRQLQKSTDRVKILGNRIN